jgi:hypothetical protein
MNRTAINNRVLVGAGKAKKDAKNFLRRGIRGSTKDLEKIALAMKDFIDGSVRHKPVRRKKRGTGFPVLTSDAEKIASLLSEADMRKNGWVKINCPTCGANCLEGVFREKQAKPCADCEGLGFRWAQLFQGVMVRGGVETVLIDGKAIIYDDFVKERQ